MEFKGDEFVRNIEIEKEKALLKQKMQSLDNEKVKPMTQQPQAFDEPVLLDIKQQAPQELNDILLNKPTQTNSENQKKYIILAFALSILFILTIIIIRLISDDDTPDKLFTQEPKVEKIDKLEKLSINDKYEEMLNQKAKKNIQKELNIKDIAHKETPLPIVETKQVKNIVKKEEHTTTDVFGMEAKKKLIAKAKPVIKPKPKPKVQQKKKPAKKVISTVKNKGYFIQVGAFTKAPNVVLINKITNNELHYIIHEMTIKGKRYNKVLIGPYKTKTDAKNNINQVKQVLKKPTAYILRLK